MKAPWDDCKVAFGIDDDEGLWEADHDRSLTLPSGWTLDEIDSSGARLVAVFRVEGVPTTEHGRATIAELRRVRAIAEQGREEKEEEGEGEAGAGS